MKTVGDLFADGEKVVYHYFPASEKDSILKNGLLCSKDSCTKNGMKKEIYVVWSDDIRVREFYNLAGYNIEHKPKDYEYLSSLGIYPKISWKEYE